MQFISSITVDIENIKHPYRNGSLPKLNYAIVRVNDLIETHLPQLGRTCERSSNLAIFIVEKNEIVNFTNNCYRLPLLLVGLVSNYEKDVKQRGTQCMPACMM